MLESLDGCMHKVYIIVINTRASVAQFFQVCPHGDDMKGLLIASMRTAARFSVPEIIHRSHCLHEP